MTVKSLGKLCSLHVRREIWRLDRPIMDRPINLSLQQLFIIAPELRREVPADEYSPSLWQHPAAPAAGQCRFLLKEAKQQEFHWTDWKKIPTDFTWVGGLRRTRLKSCCTSAEVYSFDISELRTQDCRTLCSSEELNISGSNALLVLCCQRLFSNGLFPEQDKCIAWWP